MSTSSKYSRVLLIFYVVNTKELRNWLMYSERGFWGSCGEPKYETKLVWDNSSKALAKLSPARDISFPAFNKFLAFLTWLNPGMSENKEINDAPIRLSFLEA